jgi:tetratricopeptide (TPR) repeat protein
MRKWIAIAALLVLAALPLLAAESDQRIQQAIALHDAGRYDEAIAIYKSVLADEPSNASAVYELALTYHAKQDFASCRALLEPRINQPTRTPASLYVVLGNCLDGAGESDKAIATYRKGLKLAPDDDQLLYNLGISLSSRGLNNEARELLKREVRLRPAHASGHLLLAKIFADQNFRAAAVAEYLRFLVLEPDTARSKPAAQTLLQLLNQGVEQKDAKKINVNIDPDSPKGEGDFSTFEMSMAIVSAGRFTEEDSKKSEFERTRSQVAATISILTELPATENNHTANVNVPFFAKLAEEKLVDALAGLALSSLRLEGFDEWLKANRNEVVAVVTMARGAK